MINFTSFCRQTVVVGCVLILAAMLVACDTAVPEIPENNAGGQVEVPTAAQRIAEPAVEAVALTTDASEAEEIATELPPPSPEAVPTDVLPTTIPTAVPTLTPRPSPTFAPLPPIGNILPQGYVPSDCSDKYPCNEDVAGWEARIQVPEGFMASYFAHVDGRPNALTFGPDGLLYVATMDGKIVTVDSNGAVTPILEGLLTPTGLAFQPGTGRLFVSSRVTDINSGGEAQISVVEDGIARQLYGGLPCCYTLFHAANGIAFGPDGYGYVPVGGRADHGEILDGPNAGEQDIRDPLEASILRFDPDGAEILPFARGFRNSYDLAWDGDDRLFATDNMPDYGPPEEFHMVVDGGEHGYPWYDCGGCFSPPEGVEIVPPIDTYPAHSAPTGVTSYLGHQFPGYYNSLFVTLWSAFPEAQRIIHYSPGGVEPVTWATGFAAPIDLTVGPDDSLYVADWATGIIFKISYAAETTP